MSASAVSGSKPCCHCNHGVQAPPKKKTHRITRIALAPFHALEKLFKAIFHKINYARKVIVYQCSLVFNVALNALRPNYWKWWNEIDNHIILGAEPLRNKGHFNAIKQMGVTFVLSKIENFEYKDGLLTKPVKPQSWGEANITLWRSPTVDGASVDHAQLWADVQVMHAEIQRGGKIYVHCKAGQGRSAMTVIGYYMVYHGMNFDQAYAFVRSKRHQVFLNPMQKNMMRKFKP